MTSWFDRGRPAIIEAFHDVCEQIDREIRAELEQRKTLHRDASTCATDDGAQRDWPAIIDRLEKENATLRSELSQMTMTKHREVVSDSSRSRPSPTPSAIDMIFPIAHGPHVDVSEFVKLQHRFKALDNNFKIAKEALQKRKDERDTWIRTATLLWKRITAAEEQYGIQVVELSNQALLATKSICAFSSDGRILDRLSLPLPLSTKEDGQTSRDDTQMQSTQGESEQDQELPPLPAEAMNKEVFIKQEASSDPPIVISERAVKKRKAEGSTPEVSSVRRIKIKPEDSTPCSKYWHHGINTQEESLDLDNIAQKMTTPRKRKDVDRLHQTEADDPGQLSDSPEAPSVQPEQYESHLRAETTARMASPSLLTPVSGNRQIMPPISSAKGTSAAKHQLHRAIRDLAEDSGFFDVSLANQKNANATTPLLQSRLDILLNRPNAENDSHRLEPASPQRRLGIPERRELPFEGTMRQTSRRHESNTPTARTEKPGQKAAPQGESPLERKQSASALRLKPLADLQLDDFKINPAVNDGHDFAFSEVVRDKGDRNSLRGCTDMHCCGKTFRNLALAERPDPPLTAAQRQEEQKLLEEYLGDYSYRLASMTKEERDELWVEAKTEELANKHGRHRHRFSRMQSPPGFWNADFPTTQQLEAEREEASKRRGKAIAERYREALRPGGRWLFRDE